MSLKRNLISGFFILDIQAIVWIDGPCSNSWCSFSYLCLLQDDVTAEPAILVASFSEGLIRCFCLNENDHADWPSIPPIPGLLYLEGYYSSCSKKCKLLSEIFQMEINNEIYEIISTIVKFSILLIFLGRYAIIWLLLYLSSNYEISHLLFLVFVIA